MDSWFWYAKAVIVGFSLVLSAGAVGLSEMTSGRVKADGYALTFDIDVAHLTESERLYEIPGALTLSVREAGRDPALAGYDGKCGNYLNFPGSDGRCLVLEAVLPGPAGRVGLPVSLLKENKVVVDWKNHRLQISCGARADFDFPWKDPVWTPGAEAKVLSPHVRSATFVSPSPSESALGGFFREGEKIDGPIQFWTPADHNAWVGDVAVCRFRGRFHVFYLYDRRHHASKDGKGGHVFAHVSSADLKTWVQHPFAVSIEEWWQTVGTGTPFERDGRLYLTYGWHTSRFMPESETTYPEMNAYFRKNGKMGVFRFEDLKGYPMGGTYCVSDDGVRFTNSRILFHTAQNPTVYNRTDGRLGLVNSYGGTHGYYVSDHLGDWQMYDDKIPIAGDCPCPFEWNGRHYLLQGFTGMAYSADGKPGTFANWTASGESVYGGLSVPMVAPWDGNRRILVGWINHLHGWGGWICFRELVQFEDGRLGERWLPETMPPVTPVAFGGDEAATGGRYDLLDFADLPCDSVFTLRFTDPKTSKSVEFAVDPKAGRAHYSFANPDGWREPALTVREALAADADKKWHPKPNHAGSYAIEKVRNLDRPFGVRLLLHYDAKSDATVFDAEIAGVRTMVCRREGRYTRTMRIR